MGSEPANKFDADTRIRLTAKVVAAYDVCGTVSGAAKAVGISLDKTREFLRDSVPGVEFIVEKYPVL